MYYFALTDEKGVLCVDQLDGGDREFTAEQVAVIADMYPEAIYFWVE